MSQLTPIEAEVWAAYHHHGVLGWRHLRMARLTYLHVFEVARAKVLALQKQAGDRGG